MVRETELAERQLKRTLGPVSLSALGIVAIIGAGIFSTAGTAAAGGAGHWGRVPRWCLLLHGPAHRCVAHGPAIREAKREEVRLVHDAR